jgi:hypothetical protein
LAKDERLVTPSPITALVTALPIPPGSATDSALDCRLYLGDMTIVI